LSPRTAFCCGLEAFACEFGSAVSALRGLQAGWSGNPHVERAGFFPRVRGRIEKKKKEKKKEKKKKEKKKSA
jgi:hypothetical protein